MSYYTDLSVDNCSGFLKEDILNYYEEYYSFAFCYYASVGCAWLDNVDDRAYCMELAYGLAGSDDKEGYWLDVCGIV